MKDIRHTLISLLLLFLSAGATNVFAQQDAEEQFKTGVRYEEGDSVEKDLKKAVEWFEKAANQGHPQAQLNLSGFYEYGEGVEKDLEKAAYWKKKYEENPNK